MFKHFIAKKIIIFSIMLSITGCGTQLTCSGEIGAPPEREFWCSPFSKIGNIFFVQKNYRDDSKDSNTKETIKNSVCENTIGERECNEKE